MNAGPRKGQSARGPRRSPLSERCAASRTLASPGRTSSGLTVWSATCLDGLGGAAGTGALSFGKKRISLGRKRSYVRRNRESRQSVCEPPAWAGGGRAVRAARSAGRGGIRCPRSPSGHRQAELTVRRRARERVSRPHGCPPTRGGDEVPRIDNSAGSGARGAPKRVDSPPRGDDSRPGRRT